MDNQKPYEQASLKTFNDLRTIAESLQIKQLSRLSLPEVEREVDLVAKLIPAGNVPGVILSGLARLTGRSKPNSKRDINLLFKGVDNLLNTAVYGAFFAGPAAVIWGYQKLLHLVGMKPTDAFPNGTWQFYVEYAMREDTARHTNETHGFDKALNKYHIALPMVDRVTAWVMTAIYTLHQYSDLLENEWRERVLIAYTGKPDLYREWEKIRPYGRGRDAQTDENYPLYRRIRFEQFLMQAGHRVETLYEQIPNWQVALYDYQQQMNILAYLEPNLYGEERTPLTIQDAYIGLIIGGQYYLLPACQANSTKPSDVHTIRNQIATLLAHPSKNPPPDLTRLTRLKRASFATLYPHLDNDLRRDLDLLKQAPIILNFNQHHPSDTPLAKIRQVERGVGHHALTLIDTGDTMVFDQSHIFFDGAWGATLAEIMTNEALSWAVYLQAQATPAPTRSLPYNPHFNILPTVAERIAQMPMITPEVGAETDAVHLKNLLALRKLFKQRSDLIQLTVNDILILYRAIHANHYQPSQSILDEIETLQKNSATREAAQATLEMFNDSSNPAILIPVDASQHEPYERLYPMCFEVPLTELNFIDLHHQTREALHRYENHATDRTQAYAEFDHLQRTYLATLAAFGAVMSQAKDIALQGESASVGTIKLLAHMPTPLQRMLDAIPSRFELLNDIIKGREVFSNVGAVATSSTLTRFITAKDDNEKKTLAWGVITDAKGVMRISLRDFRPHVGLLIRARKTELAQRIAKDYLESYAKGINAYVHDLYKITIASRETRMTKD